MMKRLLPILLLIAANAQARDAEDVTKFFNKGKVGNSTDYHLHKNGQPEPILTVHGFYDDGEVCMEIAATFNESQPNTYFCLPANEED